MMVQTEQQSKKPSAMTPIAIIGIGSIFPQADNPKQFWTNIRTGVDSIREVPDTHWRAEDYFDADPKAPDKVYAKLGGFLSPIAFNPMDYGILPNSLEAIDTSQLLGLVAVDQALADAGYGSGRDFVRDRVSVILGVTGTLELVVPLGARLGFPRWKQALNEAGVKDDVAADVMARISDSYVPWQENSFPGLLGNVVAGRISKHFDFGGTNCVVDAACGSSLSALNLAALELAAGRSDMVIAGGVDTFNDIFMYTCFSKTPALSPSGHARPYSDDADGTTLGEGLGIVILKRLDDAERDGDRIYATIRGIGSSSDGRGAAIYEPSAGGQSKALLRAYEQAQVTPDTIELIEGHGTGTKVGDAVEVSALRQVFGPAQQPWCALGSIKSQIGHTKAAAGAAGLIKATLALYHKVLPPTIKVNQPPANLLAADSPFYVNTECRPWFPAGDHPRRAGVSALGFGGSNFHCLLEEYQEKKQQTDWTGEVQIVPFSAPDGAEMRQQLETFPCRGDWQQLRDLAVEKRQSFDRHAACRLVIVIERDAMSPAAQISSALELITNSSADWCESPAGIYYSTQASSEKIAYLFPGQGAQYPGMLKDLAVQFPEFLAAVEEADTVFSERTEAPRKTLANLIYPRPFTGPEQKEAAVTALRATEIAQPALGAVSLGAVEILKGFNLRPAACAGHSYGELVALTAAGVLSAAELHRLSRLRGELMAADGSERGTMLAVSAPLDDIADFLDAEKLNLVLANRNTPEQGVLSGAQDEITRAQSLLAQKGISSTPLTVSAAFHSPLVAAAAEPFAQALEMTECGSMDVPVYSNTTGAIYPQSVPAIKELLAGQLAEPVDFVKEIQGLYQDGMRTFVEVGPGARLSAMVKSILQDKKIQTIALDSSNGKRSTINDLARLLAKLAALGTTVALELWDKGAGDGTASRPAAKKGMSIHLVGANYFKKPKSRPPRQSEVSTKEPTRDLNVTETKGAVPMPNQKNDKNQLQPALQQGETPSGVAAALRLTQQNIEALQSVQEQTAKLHQQFLEGQQAATRSFMQLVEQQRQLFNGAGPEVAQTFSAAQTTPISSVSAGPKTAALQVPAVPAPLSTPVAPVEIAPGVDASQVTTALLEVIAEKTGYPVEMLELGMSLDTDLGIDSIKRVEILSALQERLPELPAVRPEDLGVLQTLGQIVEHLCQGQGAQAQTPAVTAATGVDASQVTTALLEVIAEKTGYPVEMLELEMSLDTDLGIDSIKRVEILSALQEKLPAAPAIKPEHLGTLQTIAQIVDFLTSVSGSEKPVRAAQEAVSQPVPIIKRQVVCLANLAKNRPVKGLKFSPGAEVWITDDGSALIEALATALTARQLIPRRIKPAEIDKVVVPQSLAGLLIVAPLKGADDHFIMAGFRLLQQAAPVLLQRAPNGGAFFATISRLNGCFGLQARSGFTDPVSGGLAGLSKTAALEWPSVHCKALDLAMGMEVATAAATLVEEIFKASPLEVGITSTGLKTIELERQDLSQDTSELVLNEGDLVVVSGGARGVTAAVAVALARKYRPTLLLLGRSTPPEDEPDWLKPLHAEADIKKMLLKNAGNSLTPRELQHQAEKIFAAREIRATLDEIIKAGATPVYRSLDLRDGASVPLLLKEMQEQYGPVKGLIHGAGVLADKLIIDKTAEQFRSVYETKVTGCRNLLAAIDKDKLAFLVMFSSSTGRFGRIGQVDYAVANEILNKIAQHHAQAHPQTRVLSLNWGPWDGGMVTPALKKVFAREGIDVIDLQAGADYLLHELASQSEAIELVITGGQDTANLSAEDDSPQNLYISRAFDLDLAIDQFPFLKSHVIDGKAVLPLAMMIEWLAHAAIHNNPGLKFQGLNDLRVLKGVILAPGLTYNLQAMTGKAIKSDGLHVVPVELSGMDKEGRAVAHVRAKVVLAGRYSERKPSRARLDLPAYPHAATMIYSSERLFHGEAFQGLREVIGCSSAGISALVNPAPVPQQWIEQPLRNSWFADPLVLDCSFQMLILWSFEHCQAASLPVFAARYRQYQERFPASGVEIRARIISKNQHRATADIDFIDPASGQLVARLEKYECVIDASLNATFQRNRLTGVA